MLLASTNDHAWVYIQNDNPGPDKEPKRPTGIDPPTLRAETAGCGE